MNTAFAKAQGALEAACYLAATDALSWRACGAALYNFLLKRRDGNVSIPFERGPLVLEAAHRPDWQVYRGVFVKKEYAADYRDSVVIDVGAHRGIFSAFALREGCAALLAYEPGPDNFSFLEKNAERFAGAGQEVRARRQAVGAESGMRTFFTYDQSWSHSFVDRPDREAVAQTQVRQAGFGQVLSEAASLAGEDRRIIVKIDAEGAEYEMLQHPPASALAVIDELFVEVHDYAAGSPGALSRALAKSGLAQSAPHAGASGRHELLHFTRRRPFSGARREGSKAPV